jgi:hypothetical protein
MKVVISLICEIHMIRKAYIHGFVKLLERQVIYQTLTTLCMNLVNL